MRTSSLICFALCFLLFGCKETIVEKIPDSTTYTNDLLHGDLVGKVVQKSSGAKVYISQTTLLDSQAINSQDGSFAFRDIRVGNYDVMIKADNYRIYQRLNVQLQNGGITYLGEIDLSTVPDLVDGFYPADKSEIVYDWRYGRISISILFTHPMDRVSVEKAFSTSPPSEGIFLWGQYTTAPRSELWTNAKYAGFDPGATITTYSKISSLTFSLAKKDCFVDTQYTVTLSTSAKDTAGNPLRFPLKFSFRTVQSNSTIYGIQTQPVHGDIDVAPINSGGILITFPERMDPYTTEAAVQITPPMNKMFLWPEMNILKIYTGGPFLSDTTITVTIGGTAKDKDGVPLGKSYEFWFRTAPFRVSSTYPSNAQLFVSLSLQPQIRFNNYVTLSTVQSSISITPAVSGYFAYSGSYPYEDPAEIVFYPNGSLTPNTKYTVTVSRGVKDMYGIPLKEPYSFSFVTRPN